MDQQRDQPPSVNPKGDSIGWSTAVDGCWDRLTLVVLCPLMSSSYLLNIHHHPISTFYKEKGTEGIKGEPLPEKIPWEGEFTLRSDPWAGLRASWGSLFLMDSSQPGILSFRHLQFHLGHKVLRSWRWTQGKRKKLFARKKPIIKKKKFFPMEKDFSQKDFFLTIRLAGLHTLRDPRLTRTCLGALNTP